MGSRVGGLGLSVQGPGSRVQGLGFRVQSSGFIVYGLWFRVQGLRFGNFACDRVVGVISSGEGLGRVENLGSRVKGLGFRV